MVFVVKFVVDGLYRLHDVLHLILSYPLHELPHLEILSSRLLPLKLKIVLEYVTLVLPLEHPVDQVTTQQHQLGLHLHLYIFYTFMCLIEGMAHHQTIFFLVFLKIH